MPRIRKSASEQAHPGARASRPHWSPHSLPHLLHPARSANTPRICFAQAYAVPAARVAGCHIVDILSGSRRRCMRARRPRSRVGLIPRRRRSKGRPSVFVSIRVHSWFVFKRDRQFHPRMIRTPGRGRCLPETNASAWWLETGSKPRRGQWFIHIDAQDAQDFSEEGWLAVLNIRQSARGHRRSQPLVQQRRILIILCILCIHVQ